MSTKTHIIQSSLFCILCLVIGMPHAKASVIEAINPNAQPATTAIGLIYSFDQIGWYYTPAQSFELRSIASKFDVPFTITSANLLVEVTVYSERPALGGQVFSTGTITLDDKIPFGSTKPWQGGNMVPIQLQAGTQYFIGMSDLFAEGVNVSTWELVNGIPKLSGGATTSLGAYYRGNDYQTVITNEFETGGNGARISGTSPILQFSGFAVPEPGSLMIWGIAVTGLCVRTSRRRHRSIMLT